MNAETTPGGGASEFPPDLENHIRHYESAAGDTGAFSTGDWVLLAVTGVIGPVLLLIWGAM